MKLLKFPLGAENSSLNAIESVDNWLIIVDNECHVTVWDQRELIKAAFDQIKINDLSSKFKFNAYAGGMVVRLGVKNGGGGAGAGAGSDSNGNAKNGNKKDNDLKFVIGDKKYLFIGTDHKVFRYTDWIESVEELKIPVWEPVFECGVRSIITDIKLDKKLNILFIIMGNRNKIHLYDATTLVKLSDISLPENVKPITGVVDPMGKTFTVYGLDRSIIVYQVNERGKFKLLNKLTQFTQLYPLNYHIQMSPQADALPVLNSIKGASSTSTNSTILLDRNDNYKIITTLVTPPHIKTKVLKYSPMVYNKLNVKKNTRMVYNLLATSGAAEGTIMIWNTKRAKPLFNALKVSDTPINDMVWAADGMTLFAISNDNVLYNFAFQESDLGETLSLEEVQKLQQKNKQLPELVEEVKEEVVKKDVKKEVKKDTKTETKKELVKPDVKVEESSSVPASASPTPQPENGKQVPKTVKKKVKKKVQVQTTTPVVQSSTVEYNLTSYSVPKDLKRKPKEENGTELTNKKQKKDLEPMDFLDTGLLFPTVSFSRVRLATPKIRLSFEYSPTSNKNLVLDIKNGSGNEQKPTIITLTSNILDQSKVLFKDYIPKFVTLCSAGDSFWCCATEDGTIYVYSDSGKRILPPLILGVPCSFLEACSKYLLCLTSIGELYCWDIEAQKLFFPVNSIFPLLNPSLRYSEDILTRSENITLCSLTENGIPLITLSNGDGYLFDKDMETWLLVSDGWWAYGSQYWDMTNTTSLENPVASSTEKDSTSGANELMKVIKNDNKSIVNFIERKTNDELNRKGRAKNLQRFARAILMKEGFENIEEIVTLSHLENRILVTLRLNEAQEFTKLLIIYCIRLSELGYTDRLDDVLQWLYNDGDLESSKLAGKSRKELLKEVIGACADIRHIQRVTTSYASAIGLVDAEL
ncbi:hypothetical protein Kpol_526p40 [Vanderwaltozyma polyspora DSM 70294]|uniref:Protein HIR n=1 Tax=Vanderwaltozyma polyspora (strain ATCC 22028 / DSM 70294 / BCRC 21397 / CBS 2163 / NBRC 10782 / NRRL Y-8283 / UCD 57-17) TaxID=436907 RepID=A7TLU5_VANPO|nr:uncharacterized protein Kpol_526p40 [Vanderwaltozyma polyspora DSM 70294]EDO16787.1 hypothetical protein Kpol_526p40 [Vanderwaltozyma polyspora DSM 70294]